MNAGVAGAEDTCTRDQIMAAADAFDYLGMLDLARLVRCIPGADFRNDRETRMNRAYRGLVQTDALLWAAILRKYAEAPDDFDPPPTNAPPTVRMPPQRQSTPKTIAYMLCDGLLSVHELTTMCSDEQTCRWKARPVVHSRAVLHRGADCALCPYGPDWAD